VKLNVSYKVFKDSYIIIIITFLKNYVNKLSIVKEICNFVANLVLLPGSVQREHEDGKVEHQQTDVQPPVSWTRLRRGRQTLFHVLQVQQLVLLTNLGWVIDRFFHEDGRVDHGCDANAAGNAKDEVIIAVGVVKSAPQGGADDVGQGEDTVENAETHGAVCVAGHVRHVTVETPIKALVGATDAHDGAQEKPPGVHLIEEVIVEHVSHVGEDVTQEGQDEEELPSVVVGPVTDEEAEEGGGQSHQDSIPQFQFSHAILNVFFHVVFYFALSRVVCTNFITSNNKIYIKVRFI